MYVGSECDFPQFLNYMVFFYAISLIILFSNFFYQSYILKKRKTLEQNGVKANGVIQNGVEANGIRNKTQENGVEMNGKHDKTSDMNETRTYNLRQRVK